MKSLKQRLKDNEQLIGTFIISILNPDIILMIKQAGFDYITIDCEHGSFNTQQVNDMLMYSKAIGLPAMVRSAAATRELILTYMESGAAGILLPNVDTVEEAEKLVEYAKYAPLGNRGVSTLRPHTDYANISNLKDYMKQANEETFLIFQVESKKSVENVEKIIAVEGIDAAFIGPFDLSQSYGCVGEFDNPDLLQGMNKVITACKEAGKHSGIFCPTVPMLKKWQAEGATLNLFAAEGVFFQRGAAEINKAR